MRLTTVGIAIVLLGCSKTGNAEPVQGAAGVQAAPTVALVAAQSSVTSATLTATRAALVDDTPMTEGAARFQKSYDAEAAGNLEDALAALEPSPTNAPAAYVAQLRRGWLLYRLGKSADAVQAYERAVALEPASIEAKVGELAPLAALRRWVDVERVARDVLRKDPASYQATIRLAFAQYSQAKFADAATTYRGLLAAFPSDVDVRGGLGWSLVKLGKTDEAAATFAQVLEVAPKNALALDGARAAKRGK
jgi:tetratricopeptide (TPR) repeat protein